MQATDILMQEHRKIEKVLDALETATNRLSAGQVVPMDFFLMAADFMKGFADGCHHKKEEDILFVGMAANGISEETEPLSIFLEEHEEGRHLIHSLREGVEHVKGGDTTGLSQVIKNTLDYIMLLREHIQKEDHMLFPLANEVIPLGQHPQVAADFDRIEREEIGEGIHENFDRIADELVKLVESWQPGQFPAGV